MAICVPKLSYDSLSEFMAELSKDETLSCQELYTFIVYDETTLTRNHL